MSDYYVHEEDGSSHYTLEDGSGDLYLEDGTQIFERSASVSATAGIAVHGAPLLDWERSVSLGATAGISVAGSGPFDPTRVTQVPVEVIVAGVGDARTTQLAVEVIVLGVGDARVTNVAVEVIHRALYETVDTFIVDALPE